LAEVHGLVSPGFEAVREAFSLNLAGPDDGGAALGIYQHGELVVDLWGGTDPVSRRPWERDSNTVIFSATKAATSLCLLRLVDQGLVDLDAPIARYWPEFAQAGKGGIPVRWALSHRTGLPALGSSSVADMLDWDAVTARLAASTPVHEAGAHWIYHPLSFGYIVGEIVRRVTGRSLGTVFHEEIAEPLGLSFWIGTPASADDDYRPGHFPEVPAASSVRDPSFTASLSPVLAASIASTLEVFDVLEPADGAYTGTPFFNDLPFRRAEIPGGNGVATARSLAKMYAACLAPVDGVRLISPELLASATADHTLDTLPLPGPPGLGQTETRPFGLGLDPSNPGTVMMGPGSFGHSGMGGRLGFGNPSSGIGFGYVSTRLRWYPDGEDRRWTPLIAALRSSL
jgi:CubicO group peptidase (beta-lactamase class C family)